MADVLPPAGVDAGPGGATSTSAGGIAATARDLLQQLRVDDLAPGDRLPAERQLAASLGVGRAAVREVLAALELLGVLESRHGSGTYLNDNPSMLLPQVVEWGLMLQRPQTLQLIEARRHLEVALAGLAARSRDVEGLVELRRAFDLMAAAADGQDVDAFVSADAAFHLQVSRLSRNEILAGMLASVSSLLTVWMTHAVRADEGGLRETLAEHAAVVEAVADGSVAGAERAMRAHLSSAESRLFRALGQAAPHS